MNYELLADVAKIIMGQSPPSSAYNTAGEGLPFYQGKTDFGDMYPTPRVYCTEPSRIAENGDILISVRAPVGPTNVSRERSCIGRGISAIRIGEKLDRDFLLYFLRFYEPELAKAGTGSTFSAISREDLETIKVPLPPLTEQKRIASLLARADRLRFVRRAARDLGDELLQSVFLEMFGDPETNPKGWDADDFEKAILSTQNGYSPREDFNPNGTIVLRIRDISSGKVDLSDPRRMIISEKELAKYALESKDLIVVRVNGNPNFVGIASEFTAQNEPIVFSDHVIRIKMDKSRLNTTFVVYLLNSPYGRKQALGNISTTAGQFTINSSGLSRIKMIYPPLSLQAEFAGVVARVESLRGRMGESERQVENLFETLLAQLFGE
jgi:type I restriction enzyme S subunit